MNLDRYTAWLRDRALPFWLADGRDPESGFFWERLDLAGRPDRAAPLRVRVQARQVYVYAHAALTGLAPRATSLAAADRALAALRAAAWAPDGRPGWIHSVALDGGVIDDRRDLYDHAFILHALAWMAKATDSSTYRGWIEETLAFVDEGLAAPAGGWAESDRRETPRRQNPHMHLLEASLALAETGAAPRQLARAGEIVGLFRSRFYDDEAGALREYFGPRWETGPDWESGRLEPGHHMEWVWLLRRYARASGAEVGGICARLFATAERLGLDRASAFLVDEVDAGGRRLIERRRLWPQTEYLKALLVQFEATRERRLLDAADALVAGLLASYLAETIPGGWRDQFDLAGRPTSEFIPASSLYHLFAPAIEIARLEPAARA